MSSRQVREAHAARLRAAQVSVMVIDAEGVQPGVLTEDEHGTVVRLYEAGEQPPIVADVHEGMIEAMEQAGAAYLAGWPDYAESVQQYDEYLTDVGENDWQLEDRQNVVERAIAKAVARTLR